MSTQGEWWSMSSFLMWINGFIFTKKAFIFISLISSLLLSFSDKPLLLFFGPIYYFAVIFIFFILCAASMIGDSLADWAISKVFKSPNKDNLLHRCIYLVLSLISLIPGVFFVLLGDTSQIPNY